MIQKINDVAINYSEPRPETVSSTSVQLNGTTMYFDSNSEAEFVFNLLNEVRIWTEEAASQHEANVAYRLKLKLIRCLEEK